MRKTAARYGVLAVLLTGTPAFAIDRAYMVVWTPEPGKCDGPGPFQITARGLDEHEASCRTIHAARNGAGWTVQLVCAAEGETSKLNVQWQLLPNGHLREKIDGKVNDYVRCP
jgi:hypothetical protein